MGILSCEIEKDNSESQGKQIRTENKESFESKVLKQNNIALQLASWFRKLAIHSTFCVVSERLKPFCKFSSAFCEL